MKITTVDFINKANDIHNYKYDYSKSMCIDEKSKIIIICKIHNEEFELTYKEHIIKKCGCKKCDNINRKKNNKLFIEECKIIHNNKYDYSKINDNINLNDKLEIICPIHGSFFQSTKSHNCGHGCHKCGCDFQTNNENMTKDEFIEKAKKIYDNIYDYNNIIFKNCYTTIIINCVKHGEFKQKPLIHLNKFMGNCPKCNLMIQQKEKNKFFIKECKKIFKEKYNYNKTEYKNSTTHVIITCNKHGDFMETPNNILNFEKGCYLCK